MRHCVQVTAAVIGAVVLASGVAAQPTDYINLGVRTVSETLVVPVHLRAGNDIRWFKIEIAGARADSGFVDFWTLPTYVGDFIRLPRIAIYDSLGARLGVSDLVTHFTEAMLTFGMGDPRPPLTVPPPPEGFDPEVAPPFEGQSGALAPGVYWLATASGVVAFNPTNWDVRSGQGSAYPDRDTVLHIRIQPPDVPYCDGDFNWDGNTDQDDVLYLANVLAGGDNPTGRWADYNRDGNEDQDDLLALIHTIAGGGCP
ncbi:MAG: hypothetical protein DYG92_12770 [Leptolyngbya sp. PLA1]|nr:hypothetical protein [Leptolyngbya sp. PLA1]